MWENITLAIFTKAQPDRLARIVLGERFLTQVNVWEPFKGVVPLPETVRPLRFFEPI